MVEPNAQCGAVGLDAQPYDGLIVYSFLAFVMVPGLILNGLLITALPGILIGAFTARKISGSSLGPNIFIGALLALSSRSSFAR